MITTSCNKSPNWESLVANYNTKDFIPHDPVSFPHAYCHNKDWRDAELVAFLSALFSYGRRDAILKALTDLFAKLGKEPVKQLTTFSPKEIEERFGDFSYRFNKGEELVFMMKRLSEIYKSKEGSLKALWREVYSETDDIKESIHHFSELFLYAGEATPPDNQGIRFLFTDPIISGSAAKRFNLFLRWMVRSDEVDLGLWSDVTSPRELIIPLDTHVARIARKYNITQRKSNDWKTAEEITSYFRKLSPDDPVRYDFALFGLGIQGDDSV